MEQGQNVRVELGDGQWWELRPVLPYKVQKKIGRDADNPFDVVLVEQTAGWSFLETVSAEAILERDWRHIRAVTDRMLDLYGLRPAETETLKKG